MVFSLLRIVMPGLDPGIHGFLVDIQNVDDRDFARSRRCG
jgi:hypothetical protein